MKTIDRREMLRAALFVSAAAAGVVALGAQAAEALPLDARIATPAETMIQQAQVVVVAPRRRRRRVCWWSRGRRVCGWR
jgi:hypothetical protein